MTVQENLDAVRRGYAAFTTGDIDTLRQLMAEDVVHFVPGTSAIAGAHKGIDSVLELYGQLVTLSNGSMTVELEEVLSNGADQVIAIHTGRATRNGKTIETREALLFTLRDGKVAEVQDFFTDIDEQDAFWS